MTLIFQFILGMSCIVPSIAAVIKFNKAQKNYHPFFLLIWIAVITELVADIPLLLFNNYQFLAVAYPLYNIIEVVLMLSFIKRNNIQIPSWFIILAGIAGVVCFAVNYCWYLFYHQRILLWHYTAIVFLAIILVQSIRLLSGQLFTTNVSAFKNPLMIIAFGCILYYAFFLLVSIFTGLNTSFTLYGTIFSVHQIINPLTYVIFTWAIIWIPRKSRY